MMGVDRLRSARKLIFLTGAGVSAESGVPTFRGADGYWTVGSRNYHPQELATREAFSQIPAAVWGWYLYRRSVCRSARPNEGHHILAALERALGDRFLLVTQNVDGLHLRAGNSMARTFQIHGNIDYFRCWEDCSSSVYPLDDSWLNFGRGQQLTAEEQQRLRCPRCQAWARPHILWFDECYDEEHFRFDSSRLAAQGADVLVSLGTSGNTNLPLQMGQLAGRNNALLIDINPEANPFGDAARRSGGEWWSESASAGLARIAAALELNTDPREPRP